MLYWFLAGPQSKPSPHTIAQRSTSKSKTPHTWSFPTSLASNRLQGSLFSAYLPGPWVGSLPPSLPEQSGRPEQASFPPHAPSFPPHAPSFLVLPLPCVPLVSVFAFLPPTSPLPRVFVPSFTYRVSAQLACVGGRGVSACPLSLRLRPKAPPLHNSSSVACGGASGCQLELALPPWGHWVYVRVETSSRGPGRTIRFQLCVRLQGQNPCICPSLCRYPWLGSDLGWLCSVALCHIPTTSPSPPRLLHAP